MKRRDLLATLAGGVSTSILTSKAGLTDQPETKKATIGMVIYCQGIRIKHHNAAHPSEPLDDPIRFLEHCHDFGAGGMQAPLGIRPEEYSDALKEKAEQYGMFIDGVASLPEDESDLARFELTVKTAKRSSAGIIRTVMMPGRRYEEYDSMEQFQRIRKRGIRSVELAESIMRKHRVILAIENHKVQRIPELLEVLNHIGSEFVGMCYDTGNSFVLLEDPIETAKAFAPWTHTVHFKDQGLREYEDGFLFADIQYGQGFIDLPAVADIVRQGNPKAHFHVEMITRDPLKVTCLTDKYWSTMGEVSGHRLARAMRTVRDHPLDPLPRISELPVEEQIAVEEDNVKSSIAYAVKYCKL